MMPFIFKLIASCLNILLSAGLFLAAVMLTIFNDSPHTADKVQSWAWYCAGLCVCGIISSGLFMGTALWQRHFNKEGSFFSQLVLAIFLISLSVNSYTYVRFYFDNIAHF